MVTPIDGEQGEILGFVFDAEGIPPQPPPTPPASGMEWAMPLMAVGMMAGIVGVVQSFSSEGGS